MLQAYRDETREGTTDLKYPNDYNAYNLSEAINWCYNSKEDYLPHDNDILVDGLFHWALNKLLWLTEGY
jgi:hypothetical protein